AGKNIGSAQLPSSQALFLEDYVCCHTTWHVMKKLNLAQAAITVFFLFSSIVAVLAFMREYYTTRQKEKHKQQKEGAATKTVYKINTTLTAQKELETPNRLFDLFVQLGLASKRASGNMYKTLSIRFESGNRR